MSIEQTVVEKFRVLPLDKQQEVLDFIEFLESKSNGHPSLTNRWKGMTALEAAQRYAGTVEGPEDLSTNPALLNEGMNHTGTGTSQNLR